MHASGSSQTVGKLGATGRPRELATALVLVVPRNGVEVEDHAGAASRAVTIDGGLVRFGSARIARDGR
jgi:hypothetical protein